jgi:hypothetical protein
LHHLNFVADVLDKGVEFTSKPPPPPPPPPLDVIDSKVSVRDRSIERGDLLWWHFVRGKTQKRRFKLQKYNGIALGWNGKKVMECY